MGLEIFAAALSTEDLIRGDFVASRVGSYIKEGAQLNAKLVKEVLQARSLELAGHLFNRDIISEAQAVRRDIFAGFVGVEAGLEGLRATFDWGFGQVIWQLELQTETLQNILKVLQAPLDTQAKELRRRAEYAYQNGWIDKAEQDFLESAGKNYQDFSVHFSLGMIYLYHKINFEKALKYFQQTVKYAKPDSPRYTAQGWFYTGFVFYLQHKYSEAIEAMNQTLKFNPEFPEAHYQLAKNFALLSKPGESVENLSKAILADKDYCLKADMDKDFDGIRSHVNALFKLLKQEARAKIMVVWRKVSLEDLEKIERVKPELWKFEKRMANKSFSKKLHVKNNKKFIELFSRALNALEAKYRLETLELANECKVLLERGSYFDYLLVALPKVEDYNRITKPIWDSIDDLEKLPTMLIEIEAQAEAEIESSERWKEEWELKKKRNIETKVILFLIGVGILGLAIGVKFWIQSLINPGAGWFVAVLIVWFGLGNFIKWIFSCRK